MMSISSLFKRIDLKIIMMLLLKAELHHVNIKCNLQTISD